MGSLVFALALGGWALVGFGGETVERLLAFDTPASLAGVMANAWGGAKTRWLAYDSERGCVRLAWSNSNVTVCFRGLPRLLPGAPGFTGDPFGRYALEYRAVRMEGVGQFNFRRGNLDWVTIAGLRRDGRRNVVFSAPTGWNREGLSLATSRCALRVGLVRRARRLPDRVGQSRAGKVRRRARAREAADASRLYAAGRVGA